MVYYSYESNRALLELCWWIAAGKVLIFYMDRMEAPSDLRVEIGETQRLILGERGCLFDNGPKLTVGQHIEVKKTF